MRNKINKRGGIADLVSLSTATIIIVIILVLFMLFAGIVKVAERVENGEKIYNDWDVGVGNMNRYMLNYDRLVNVTGRVRRGEAIEDALKVEGYEKKEWKFVSSYRNVPFTGRVFHG